MVVVTVVVLETVLIPGGYGVSPQGTVEVSVAVTVDAASPP